MSTRWMSVVVVVLSVTFLSYLGLRRNAPSARTEAIDDRPADFGVRPKSDLRRPAKQLPASTEPSGLRFHSELIEIAKTYEDYGRVDDEARWAPGLCRAPFPSKARFSHSTDDTTHGGKLYFVFARRHNDYNVNKIQPVGQVLVKEAWRPAKVDPSEVTRRAMYVGFGETRESYVYRFAEKNGALYRADEKVGLFIMMKVDSQTPDTDSGWVYGTVAADGKTVTSAGRVMSCMKCHQESSHDRLFGLSSVF